MRNITTVEDANAYLPKWIAREHNQKFTISAKEPGTAFVPYFGSDLDKIWSNQHERVVNNDNTVSYQNLSLQIPQQTFRFSLAKCGVLVCRHLDQTISLYYGLHQLGRYDSQGQLLPAPSAKTGQARVRPASRSASISDPGAKFSPTAGPNAAKGRKKNKTGKKAA